MKTEKEKMLAGELYVAADPELNRDRIRTRQLTRRFNDSEPTEQQMRLETLRQLLGACGEDVWIEPPLRCDYGYNIFLGDRVQINFNCVMLDVCPIRIGNDTLIAPNVQLLAATHPTDWQVRTRGGPELGRPITIGSDCWLGAGVIVCPGVTIGDRTVIGAGAVVVRDIPSDCVAVGNPARIIRQLDNK